jgi:hypothetical protein
MCLKAHETALAPWVDGPFGRPHFTLLETDLIRSPELLLGRTDPAQASHNRESVLQTNIAGGLPPTHRSAANVAIKHQP